MNKFSDRRPSVIQGDCYMIYSMEEPLRRKLLTSYRITCLWSLLYMFLFEWRVTFVFCFCFCFVTVCICVLCIVVTSSEKPSLSIFSLQSWGILQTPNSACVHPANAGIPLSNTPNSVSIFSPKSWANNSSSCVSIFFLKLWRTVSNNS